MTSSDPEAYPVFQCCFCDRSYYNKRALGAHRRFCKLKVTGQNAAGQEEAASNAQGGIDVLNFRIARRQRTVRKKEEALPVLSEQSENNPASDDAQVGNNGASGFHMPKRKRPILTEPTTSDVKADWEPEKEVYVLEPLLLLQEQPGKEPGSDGEPGTANPDDELAADNPDEVLMTCFDKSSSSVECYRGCERWGNLPAVVGREVERLSHNEGIDVLNFHIARRQRTVRKKEALPVLSEQPENNPDSDDAQVGNNGASGFHMPKRKRPILTEPTTSDVKADWEPEKEVVVLEPLLLLQEQPGKEPGSDGEPGTANPDDELAADNPDEVLTTCFDKSSSSVECYGGCERWGNLPAVVGREVERLSHNEGIDVLNFHIARRQRTVRKKEEALPVLSEQPENNPDSDDAQVGNNGASGFHMPKRKRPILTEPTTSEVKADWEPEKEVGVLEPLLLLQEQPGKEPGSDGEPGTANPDDELAADNPDEVLTTCFDKSSSSVECYGGCERWGNLPAVVGREAERLSHNDGSQGVTDCVDNYGVMHNQNKKFDISDPVVTQQQNQKLDLNVLAPTDNSDNKTLTLSFSTMEQKNSASVDCYGGIEKNGNEAPVVEEELELSHNFGRQGVADCPENSAVMELRGHNKLDLNVCSFVQEQNVELDLNVCSFVQEQNVEPDLKVSDDSVVMQEKNLNIDLNAPVPTINSDTREGQTKLTATDNFLKKSGNEVPVAVKEDVLPSASDHHLSLMQEQNQKLEVKPKLPDLNL